MNKNLIALVACALALGSCVGGVVAVVADEARPVVVEEPEPTPAPEDVDLSVIIPADVDVPSDQVSLTVFDGDVVEAFCGTLATGVSYEDAAQIHIREAEQDGISPELFGISIDAGVPVVCPEYTAAQQAFYDQYAYEETP